MLAGIKCNDVNSEYWEDFEAAVSYLIPTDPVKESTLRKKNGHADISGVGIDLEADVGVIQSTRTRKPARGKTEDGG